jgi:hypothetical protein
MVYFDSVQTPSSFRQQALSEKPRDFASLLNAASGPVSLWNREHLFALRVLCQKPTTTLGVLNEYLPSPEELKFNPFIRALLDGPGHDNKALSEMSEPQIVRSSSSDGVGAVWAALGALLRPRDNQRPTTSSSAQQDEETPNLGVRARQPPKFFNDPVPTESIQFGSSPPYERPSTSGSSASSVGYTENPPAPAVEDLTLRLAGCFVRYVLNYGQEYQNTPILEFRDERVSVSYKFSSPKSTLLAIDDGGIRKFEPGQVRQVALMEAKRCFQAIENGRPTVSDGLLAQMAGQALLSLVDDGHRGISSSR